MLFPYFGFSFHSYKANQKCEFFTSFSGLNYFFGSWCNHYFTVDSNFSCHWYALFCFIGKWGPNSGRFFSAWLQQDLSILRACRIEPLIMKGIWFPTAMCCLLRIYKLNLDSTQLAIYRFQNILKQGSVSSPGVWQLQLGSVSVFQVLKSLHYLKYS